ncbi:MAG: Bax inhibitor-1 family protein [Oscillospiraceae bacterium]|jgi:FtsH-binding integral membrane protein
MNQYNDYDLWERQEEIASRSAIYLAKVMGWMCVGLFTTVVSAMLCLAIPALWQLVFGSGIGFFGVLIAQVVLVLALSARIHRMSAATATVMFMLYSAVTGLTMSALTVAYRLDSIILSFGVTTALFLVMSLYGLVTRKDLSRWGSLLFFGLLGIILAGVVNLFLGSSTMDFLITVVGILIFIGLIAYDTQKIKAIYQSSLAQGYDDEDDLLRKLAIFGALTLYLDFINLFLKLLRLLGRRRD